MAQTDLEKDFDNLFDERQIAERRDAAEMRYGGMTTDQYNHFRRRAKNDLFFLCRGPLEYTLMSPRLHGSVANWIRETRGHQYRMLLLPRDHYKSTMFTVADAIQMALPNVGGVVEEHPYCLGPNIKLLIAHEIRESASRMLFGIAAAFTKKPLMMHLFPECIPTRKEQRMNKWELELPRDEHHNEPTYDTIGAGGAAQSRHYHWLKLDDLIGEEARDSETVMKRTLQWFDNVNSLLTRLKLDGWDLIGTRWAYSDIYSHAMSRYGIDEAKSVLNCIPSRDQEEFVGGLLAIYARGALENGEPIFPEEFPLENLQVLMKNRLVWSAQYANNPLESGLNEFQWPLKYYNADQYGNIVVFTGESRKKLRVQDLDICVLCDPSMGESDSADPSGLVVTGTDPELNVYILETIKKRLLPPEFVDEIFRLHLKYRPRAIAIEEVAFSAIYKYWIAERSQHHGIHPNIRTYKPGSKKTKTARIRGLSNFFAAGQILMAEGMFQLRDEYERFPFGDDEHLLDALAQGPQFWAPGLQSQDVDHIEKGYREAFEDERSILTGY